MVARGVVDRVPIVCGVGGRVCRRRDERRAASCHNSAIQSVGVASDVAKDQLPNDALASCQPLVISGAQVSGEPSISVDARVLIEDDLGHINGDKEVPGSSARSSDPQPR